MNTTLKFIVFAFISMSFNLTWSQVRVPKLISNGMILQRDAEVNIWGWASPGEKISVDFNKSTCNTTSDIEGNWKVTLKKMKAGGPYEMRIKGKNIIIINNIMIGDVWVCSGQSNMELPMRRVSWKYPEEMTGCTNTNIRQFAVPQKYNFHFAEKDLSGGIWKEANPQNIQEFSAVAYFFAKELYNKYKIPIGIINASLGGSPAEAWLSQDALKKFPVFYNEALKFRDSSLIKKTESDDNRRIQEWYRLLGQKDEGYKTIPSWRSENTNTADWDNMEIPGYWNKTKLGPVNGSVWFRKEITIPASAANSKALLILGRIIDADSVFINGIFAGTTSYQYPPRRYELNKGILKEGVNTIVIKVISNSGIAGFVPDKTYQILIGNETIDLRGNWQYKLGATMDPLGSQTFVRWKPSGLFNSMIAPLLNYRIKGVAWYQGESNATRYNEYRELLTTLIQTWRKNWNQGNFPFLIVQLANYMEPQNQPSDSDWARLREAQFKTLALPNTGLAVIHDLGEWNDIHPLNKKDVGKRLALAAFKLAYNENNVVYSGPIYQSMKITGNKIILSFSNIGTGLSATGGDALKYFSVAGSDKKFIWANVKIEGNKLIVWNENIPNPVAVRYAWADNPEGANLYNKQGLPASSFRTDNWDK